MLKQQSRVLLMVCFNLYFAFFKSGYFGCPIVICSPLSFNKENESYHAENCTHNRFCVTMRLYIIFFFKEGLVSFAKKQLLCENVRVILVDDAH